MFTVVDGLPLKTLSVKLPSAATTRVDDGDGLPSALAPQFSQPSNVAALAPSEIHVAKGVVDTVHDPSRSTATLLMFTPTLTPATVPMLFAGAETHAIPAPAKPLWK